MTIFGIHFYLCAQNTPQSIIFSNLPCHNLNLFFEAFPWADKFIMMSKQNKQVIFHFPSEHMEFRQVMNWILNELTLLNP